MRYSVVPSEQTVKNYGLNWAVVQLEPRVTLAVFKDEAPAMRFAKEMNGGPAPRPASQSRASDLSVNEGASTQDFEPHTPEQKAAKEPAQTNPQTSDKLTNPSEHPPKAGETKPTETKPGEVKELSLSEKVAMAQSANATTK